MARSVDVIWDDITELFGVLGFDLDYAEDAREALIIFESREPIEGFSKPPFGHFEQFWALHRSVNETANEFSLVIQDIEVERSDPFYPNYMSKEIESRIDNVVTELYEINNDARKHHVDLRAQFVKTYPETKTEYVSEINEDRMVELTLLSFCRSDKKEIPFFVEFKSIPGAKFSVDLNGKHVTIMIGEEVDLEHKYMEIISSVRKHIGLPPAYEIWEIEKSPMVGRILGEKINERTLAKKLWPDDTIWDSL